MELDVKKITKTPKDQWEAIHYLVKSEQNLIEAIHIMQSVLDNPDEMDFHNHRIKDFIKRFEADTKIEMA